MSGDLQSFPRRVSVGRRPSILWTEPIHEVIEESASQSPDKQTDANSLQSLKEKFNLQIPFESLTINSSDRDCNADGRSSRKSSIQFGVPSTRRSSSVDIRRPSLSRRPSIIGPPFSSRFTAGRRQSVTRRSSLAASIPTKLHEASVLEDIVPLLPNPRFASTLSTEAQFALLKGYEDALATQLGQLYPERKSQITRTKTPRNTKIAFKGGDDGLDGDDFNSIFSDSESTAFITHTSNKESGNRVSFLDKAKPALNVNSFNHPISEQPSARFGQSHIPPQSVRSSVSDAPWKRQINLSRRVQMAQSLLDSFDQQDKDPITNKETGHVSLTPSSRRVSLDDFDLIQGYQWWSSSWPTEFEVIEERNSHLF